MKTYRELQEKTQSGIKGTASVDPILGGIVFEAPGIHIVIDVLNEANWKKLGLKKGSVKAKADITTS